MLVEKDDKDLVIVVIEFGGNNSKIVRRKLILDKWFKILLIFKYK